MSVTLIFAAAENGVIGKAGAIPWRIADDMKRFKALTMGKTVIMGRKTWDSLPRKPLPGRRNIVVTRNIGLQLPNDVVRATLPEIDLSYIADGQDVMVIGGAEIYRYFLRLADRIELTEVHRAFEGDAVFTFDRAGWREIAREDHVTPDGLAYSYITLVRSLTPSRSPKLAAFVTRNDPPDHSVRLRRTAPHYSITIFGAGGATKK